MKPILHPNETFGVHFRTLGDVAYLMTSLNTPDAVVREVERKVLSALLRSTHYESPVRR